ETHATTKVQLLARLEHGHARGFAVSERRGEDWGASFHLTSPSKRYLLQTRIIGIRRSMVGFCFRAATTVGDLHRWGCPSAIPRRVGAVVVDAIDGQAGRRIAHIGIEIFEAQPVFANRDAATAVIGIAFIVWIKATLQHGTPNPVNSGPTHAVLCRALF